LLNQIDDELSLALIKQSFMIPHKDYSKLSLIFEQGRLVSRSDEVDGIRCEAYVSAKLANILKPYVV